VSSNPGPNKRKNPLSESSPSICPDKAKVPSIIGVEYPLKVLEGVRIEAYAVLSVLRAYTPIPSVKVFVFQRWASLNASLVMTHRWQ